MENEKTPMDTDPKFNEMQTVKRHLYAMRNGVIADTLRKGGSPFKIIFGVNLPQLSEIARSTGQNAELAERLWANSTTRESMLLAPMLMPAEDFDEEHAKRWIAQIPATEVADVLCLKLLRRAPYALELAQKLYESTEFMSHYTGLRLMCNLASQHPEAAKAMGDREMALADPRTRLMAIQLSESYL